jgi:hypothetical protein
MRGAVWTEVPPASQQTAFAVGAKPSPAYPRRKRQDPEFAQPSTPKRSIGFVLHEDGNANKGSTEGAAKVVKAQRSKKA